MLRQNQVLCDWSPLCFKVSRGSPTGQRYLFVLILYDDIFKYKKLTRKPVATKCRHTFCWHFFLTYQNMHIATDKRVFFTKINQQADLKLEVNKNEIVPSRSRCFWHYWSICLLNSYIRYLIHLKISAINVQQGKPGDAVSVSLVNNGWTERTVGQHSQHGVWHFLVNTDTDVNLQSHLSHRQSNLVMNICIILLLSLQQNQSIKNPVLFNEPLRTQNDQ